MFLFGLASQLWVLFVARALNGILSSAAMPTAMAYVADNTPADQRGGGMGQLGAAAGIGIILGPGIGGALASASLSTPFFIASGMCLLALVLIWLFLPESHTAGMHQCNPAVCRGAPRDSAGKTPAGSGWLSPGNPPAGPEPGRSGS